MATHAELPDDSDEVVVDLTLPELLYVRREADPEEPEITYLVATQQPGTHCPINSEVVIGEYKLVRMVTVRSVVTVRPAEETPLQEPAAE